MKIKKQRLKLFSPEKDSHKGQNGKLLIIGGSRGYHGAPMFSILAARRFIDLLYFYPGEDDPHLISAAKTIPEAMVVYDLARLREVDCVLFGIGLGDAKFDTGALSGAKRLVIDGDGLKDIKEDNWIPPGSILTPHEGEFRMFFGMEGIPSNVKEMAKKNECVILKKGPVDIISDGKRVETNTIHNQGMTHGGTGDVLAGLVAALYCKNDAFTAAFAGARINGIAGNMAMKRYGFNFCASDVADNLSEAYRIFEKERK